MMTDLEKIAKRKAYCKEWREKNKEKIQEYRKKHDSKNKERKNAREREYYQKNREKIISKNLEYYRKHKKESVGKRQQTNTNCEKNKRTNICADCCYPIKDCPWLHKGKEVPGWDAERVQWSVYTGVYTYTISDCPLFIPCKRKCDGQEL